MVRLRITSLKQLFNDVVDGKKPEKDFESENDVIEGGDVTEEFCCAEDRRWEDSAHCASFEQKPEKRTRKLLLQHSRKSMFDMSN